MHEIIEQAFASRGEWRFKALCLTKPTNRFYPETERQETIAVAICNRCPVKDECLAYALNTQEPYGVWGGKTEKERARILKLQ